MKRLALVIPLFIVFVLLGSAHAVELSMMDGCSGVCSASCSRSCAPCWCPDDYCRKPMPCVCPPPICGCCDDYCRKPMPCVCPPAICGCCDDYCRKPMPCVWWPCPWPDYYRCGPPAR